MTETYSQKRVVPPARRGLRKGVCVSMLAILFAVAGHPSPAQPVTQDPLLPPPRAPESRLTVTPHDFERWLSTAPGDRKLATAPDESAPQRLVTPPPAPRLATPPPAPTLATPPPPSIQPTPGAPAPTPAVARPGPPPPPPDLSGPPEPPELATLPPDSGDTTRPREPPVGEAVRPDDIRILYAAEATDLPGTARSSLDRLAAWLRENPSVRVEIVGYAETSSPAESEARRLSLLRAREVRGYLVDRGVLSTRIDVRALGSRTEETPRNRVDVRVPPP